ncbi:hypothetical protein [Streptomyces sp. AMCC400023]|uniref:hypothetical protein n=1 Tax=Streptomyces sp. AMCC400023 TaxID=2056258 RepID=UPI001F2AE9D3|nr:hypothetical protein [Streptomyces sp. AMCC400023]UJV42998.1 hypothetical protein CVT30_26950 [Streptomyces sp. AMCC400023]
MAVRNTPGKRLVGNPLGGILRDLDRQARRTTRRRGVRPSVAVETGQDEAGSGLLIAALATDGDGRVRWHYPDRFAAPPILSALAVAAVPVVVTVEEVTAAHAVLRTWVGKAPAPYVALHVTAAVGPGEGAATLAR